MPSNQNDLQLIRQWFSSPLGQQLKTAESAIIDQLLADSFGSRLLQVSVQQQDLFQASHVAHKFSMGLSAQDENPFVANPVDLPFESDALDFVILHHLLDFIGSPQEALRESSRVLSASGQLMIIGFNPYSLWGLWKALAVFNKSPPWNGNFVSPLRLMDWMNLLNFKIDRAQYCTYGFPTASLSTSDPDYSRGISRQVNWPLGAVFIIVGRKQVGAMTRRRPVWKPQKSFGQLSVVPGSSRVPIDPDSTRN